MPKREKQKKQKKQPRSKRARSSEQPAAPAAVAAAAPPDAAAPDDAAPPRAKRKVLTHRCSSVGWMPSGVTSISAHQPAAAAGGGYLALGRENGNVEVWSLDEQHCCQRLVGGDASAAEAVSWTPDGRVISAGLQGEVTLWDRATLRPAEAVDSYGGAVWDAAFNDATNTLAIACEDGCVRLFDYAAAASGGGGGGSLTYRLALAGFTGRALSATWTQDGSRLFAGGSDGTIRRWTLADLPPGSPPACDLIVSTNTGGEGGESTLIWALAVAADATLISADSQGFTKFWDGEHGTLMHEFHAHVADVLTLAVGNDGRSVFSSGADPAIVHFQCVGGGGGGGGEFMQWVLSAKQSAAHTHDVRALAVTTRNGGASERLWSAGVDTILCSATLARFSSGHRRHWASPCPPAACLAQTGTAAAPLMLFHHDAHLEVWRMGTHSASADPAGMQDGQAVDVATQPRVLVELRPKAGRTMTGSSISVDGRWVACAAPGEVKLFRLTYETSPSSVESVRVQKVAAALLPPELGRSASGALAFSANSQQLIVGSAHGKIDVLDLNTFQVVRSFTVNSSFAVALSRFALSADGVWLAALDAKNRVRIYNLDSMRHHSTLPSLDGVPTALAFDAGCDTLVVAISTAGRKKLFLHNVEGRPIGGASTGPAQQFSDVDVPGNIAGLTFDPEDPTAVLCWGHQFLARAVVQTNNAADGSGASQMLSKAAASTVTRLEALLFAASTAPATLLTIERQWLDVVEQLPDPIVRPKYGT